MDDLDALESYLTFAAQIDAYSVPLSSGGGHPGKFVAVLDGGLTLMVKPAHTVQEGPQVIRNESAAWYLARLLGWASLVSPTVIRSVKPVGGGESVEAAVQMWLPHFDFCPSLDVFSDEDLWHGAVLDYLTAHSDRGNGNGAVNNWAGVPLRGHPMGGRDIGIAEKSALRLLDHGYTFNAQGRPAQSAFVDRKRGNTIPAEVLLPLVGLTAEAVRRSRLSYLLTDTALNELLARAEILKTQVRIP